MASASQISFRNLGRQSWASVLTPRGGTRDGTPGRRALRVVAESRRDCPGQRRTAERLRRGREGWVGIGAEIIPKVSSNAGQSLSQPAADSSLCTRETFPCGGRGMRITVTGESVFFLQGNGGVRSPRPTKQGGKLPQLPGQRSERGKSRWSNLIFAR